MVSELYQFAAQGAEAIETRSKVSSREGEIVSIQQLRGLAAVGVLCFHACRKAGLGFDIGAAGVDVFFVISGFIMWVISTRAPIGPGEFLLRRAVRIAPLYWLTTLSIVALFLISPKLFPVMKLTTAHVVESLFFIPHRDPDGFPAPVIAAGWTLNYEAFFYLLFAVALRLWGRERAALVTVALVLLVLLRPLAGAGATAQTYTDPILLEFAAGLWLGAAFTSGRLPGRVAGLGLIASGLAAFAVLYATGLDPKDLRVLFWGVPAFAIVAGAVSIERAGLVLKSAALEKVGDASYSIYLVHGLMVSLAAKLLGVFGLGSGPAVLVGGLALGLAGGLLCWAFVERPLGRVLRRAVRSLSPRRRAPSAAA